MNPNLIPGVILLPLIVGTLCLITPRKVAWLREALAIITSVVTFGITYAIFAAKPSAWLWKGSPILMADNLSSYFLLAIGLFGVLISLYSISFMRGKVHLNQYYGCLLWTLGAALVVALANNLILLLVFWGFLGLTLYLLINLGDGLATQAAKKTLVIVGGSDSLMMLGIGIIWYLTGSFRMDQIHISLLGGLPVLAYLALAVGSFAKVGAIPLHSWIPDTAESAPTTVTAFLPGALDKILGLYLLARITLDLFVMNKSMGLLLMVVGSVTIAYAVMMALIQRDLKRLIAYLAISGAGYMILGIGTGVPVGIQGGLFYMLNSAIWSSCLFLCVGGVEYRMRTLEINRLGGLVRAMPVTFITYTIAALAISGIPPLNGFVSKWMVYQGLIEVGRAEDPLWIIWLVAAMFGSALTLASIIKLTHVTFLGQPSEAMKDVVGKVKEIGFAMVVPLVILAGLCVVFGVFAYQIPLKFLIYPSVGEVPTFLGFWSPMLATWLILVGIAIGLVIYLLGNIKGVRKDTPYIGGEISAPEMTISGVDFYETIKDLGLFKKIYSKAEARAFDIYDIGKNSLSCVTKALRSIHTGILTTYLGWVLLGVAVLFWLFLKVVK